MTQQEIELWGVEITKERRAPIFGQKMEYDYIVSYNFGIFDRHELLEMVDYAESLGGSYDRDMDFFVMPTEDAANLIFKKITETI